MLLQDVNKVNDILGQALLIQQIFQLQSDYILPEVL